MLASRLETRLAWRYLLRRERRPRALTWGLSFFFLGAVSLWLSGYIDRWDAAWAEQEWALGQWGSSYGAERALAGIGQGIQVAGVALVAIGACQSLFGALYMFLTPFAAFSTFMVAIGVAEVILVLGVMNGFQGFLREKLVDANAHISMESTGKERWMGDYAALAEEARSQAGVLGVSPLLSEEVMVRRIGARSAEATLLFGVEAASINETIGLSRFLDAGCGCMSWLDDPMRLQRHIEQLPIRTSERFCRCVDESGSSTTSIVPDAPAPVAGGLMAFPAPSPPPPPPPLFLGQHLQTRLGVRPGDQIEVIAPLGELGPSGPIPRIMTFTCAGWLNSGLVEVDNQHSYTSLKTLQRFLKSGNVVSSLRVRAAGIEEARPIRDLLRARFEGRLLVSDWRERNQSLFSALKLERIAMFLVLTINILLAAFSIVSTLMMSLIERRREIAILRACGATKRLISGVFVRQGLAAGGLGAFLGTSFGLGGALSIAAMRLPRDAKEIYYISSIPVELRAGDIFSIVSVALVVTLIATLYPARHAASLAPVEGLKGK